MNPISSHIFTDDFNDNTPSPEGQNAKIVTIALVGIGLFAIALSRLCNSKCFGQKKIVIPEPSARAIPDVLQPNDGQLSDASSSLCAFTETLDSVIRDIRKSDSYQENEMKYKLSLLQQSGMVHITYQEFCTTDMCLFDLLSMLLYQDWKSQGGGEQDLKTLCKISQQLSYGLVLYSNNDHEMGRKLIKQSHDQLKSLENTLPGTLQKKFQLMLQLIADSENATHENQGLVSQLQYRYACLEALEKQPGRKNNLNYLEFFAMRDSFYKSLLKEKNGVELMKKTNKLHLQMLDLLDEQPNNSLIHVRKHCMQKIQAVVGAVYFNAEIQHKRLHLNIMNKNNYTLEPEDTEWLVLQYRKNLKESVYDFVQQRHLQDAILSQENQKDLISVIAARCKIKNSLQELECSIIKKLKEAQTRRDMNADKYAKLYFCIFRFYQIVLNIRFLQDPSIEATQRSIDFNKEFADLSCWIDPHEFKTSRPQSIYKKPASLAKTPKHRSSDTRTAPQASFSQNIEPRLSSDMRTSPQSSVRQQDPIIASMVEVASVQDVGSLPQVVEAGLENLSGQVLEPSSSIYCSQENLDIDLFSDPIPHASRNRKKHLFPAKELLPDLSAPNLTPSLPAIDQPDLDFPRKNAKPSEVLNILIGHGFVIERIKGSHYQMKHAGTHVTTTVPYHGRPLTPDTLVSIRKAFYTSQEQAG